MAAEMHCDGQKGTYTIITGSSSQLRRGANRLREVKGPPSHPHTATYIL